MRKIDERIKTVTDGINVIRISPDGSRLIKDAFVEVINEGKRTQMKFNDALRKLPKDDEMFKAVTVQSVGNVEVSRDGSVRQGGQLLEVYKSDDDDRETWYVELAAGRGYKHMLVKNLVCKAYGQKAKYSFAHKQKFKRMEELEEDAGYKIEVPLDTIKRMRDQYEEMVNKKDEEMQDLREENKRLRKFIS